MKEEMTRGHMRTGTSYGIETSFLKDVEEHEQI
jgi:hypothetical protein